MDNDDERKLDEENDTRTEAEEETAIGDASGAVVGEWVTNPVTDQNSKS